jgi:hypothetical protein
VVGSTNDRGERPKDRPLHPCLTLYVHVPQDEVLHCACPQLGTDGGPVTA